MSKMIDGIIKVFLRSDFSTSGIELLIFKHDSHTTGDRVVNRNFYYSFNEKLAKIRCIRRKIRETVPKIEIVHMFLSNRKAIVYS